MTTPARPSAAPATADTVRAKFDQAQGTEAVTFTHAEVGTLLGEIDRLRALLAGGVTEYAVQAYIDDRPSTTEEYGTEREALLIRLEQQGDQQLSDYRLTVLTRRTVHTPWAETSDPELRAALGD